MKVYTRYLMPHSEKWLHLDYWSSLLTTTLFHSPGSRCNSSWSPCSFNQFVRTKVCHMQNFPKHAERKLSTLMFYLKQVVFMRYTGILIRGWLWCCYSVQSCCYARHETSEHRYAPSLKERIDFNILIIVLRDSSMLRQSSSAISSQCVDHLCFVTKLKIGVGWKTKRVEAPVRCRRRL